MLYYLILLKANQIARMEAKQISKIIFR